MKHCRLVAGFGLTVVLGAVTPACKKDEPRTAADEATVVARIDGENITLADFEMRMKELPTYVRSRYASPERRKELLDNLVRFELLAREAKKRGYERDPDVVRYAKQRLIEKMMAAEVDAKLHPQDLPEADLRRFYNDNAKLFTQVEAVRVSQIVVADKALAQKVADQARALAATDTAGFEKLVAEHSQDVDSRQRGGDLTFIDRGSTELPLHLIEAAFALKNVGDVSPPVRGDKGFHVLRLTQRKAGFVRPFEDVKGEVRKQLYQQRRIARIDELVAEMRKGVKVEVFQDKLEQLIKNPPARPPADAGAADRNRAP
jgi:peptidyl-prolyl cis-trans isomerase C